MLELKNKEVILVSGANDDEEGNKCFCKLGDAFDKVTGVMRWELGDCLEPEGCGELCCSLPGFNMVGWRLNGTHYEIQTSPFKIIEHKDPEGWC